MRTSLYFYLNDKEETEITSIHNIDIVPFKKGDKFWFTVEMLFPITINKWRKEYKENFINHICESHKEKEKFNNSRFKIISVFNSLKYDINSNDNNDHSIRIEYKCKKIKRIYWKFWRTYKFKQFFKNLF